MRKPKTYFKVVRHNEKGLQPPNYYSRKATRRFTFGKWHSRRGEIMLCTNGFHACDSIASLRYWMRRYDCYLAPGTTMRVYEVKLGNIIKSTRTSTGYVGNAHKVVSNRVRLVRRRKDLESKKQRAA